MEWLFIFLVLAMSLMFGDLFRKHRHLIDLYFAVVFLELAAMAGIWIWFAK